MSLAVIVWGPSEGGLAAAEADDDDDDNDNDEGGPRCLLFAMIFFR